MRWRLGLLILVTLSLWSTFIFVYQNHAKNFTLNREDSKLALRQSASWNEFVLRTEIHNLNNMVRISNQNNNLLANKIPFNREPYNLHMDQIQNHWDHTTVLSQSTILESIHLNVSRAKCANIIEPSICTDLPSLLYFGPTCRSDGKPICFRSGSRNNSVNIVQLKNVLIDPASGLMVVPQHNATLDQLHMESHWYNPQREVKAVIRVPKIATITQIWGDNYYHYVDEQLVKVVMMKELLLNNPDIFLLIKNGWSYVNQVDWFTFGSKRIAEFDRLGNQS
jgi:hypothetical protein